MIDAAWIFGGLSCVAALGLGACYINEAIKHDRTRDSLQRVNRALVDRVAEANREADRWRRAHKDVEPRIIALYRGLAAVEAQETEGANSTVRRMARIARQTMLWDDEGDFSERGGSK